MSESKAKHTSGITPLTCPYCGGMPMQVGRGVESDPFVACRACRAVVYGKTLRDAVQNWNARVAAKAAPDLLTARAAIRKARGES